MSEELQESINLLTECVRDLTITVKALRVELSTVKRKRKEPKEKENSKQEGLSLRLDHQIGSTDCSKRDSEWSVPSPLISIQSDMERRKVRGVIVERWLKTYEDPKFIIQEINKAEGWVEANQRRAPKSHWARFYSGWLSRAWESYRKSNTGQFGDSHGGCVSAIDKVFNQRGDTV